MSNKSFYRAHTNIALIKYWGKRNHQLHLPQTSSLSLTLDGFYTDTRVTLDPSLNKDTFELDGMSQSADHIRAFLDIFRQESGNHTFAKVESYNQVPTAAGLASSASAFAALACASNDAFGTHFDNRTLSTIARQGSGSACRSLFGGFVLWHKGDNDNSLNSYSEMIDSAEFDIAMIAVVVNADHKKISSRVGMEYTVKTSPFYALWPEEVEKDLNEIIPAIENQDVDKIGEIAEHNAMKMHASMIASRPSFTYWEKDSLLAMELVRNLREEGLSCYYTMDAGPNVKIICPMSQTEEIINVFKKYFDEDKLIVSKPGSAPYLVNEDEVKI